MRIKKNYQQQKKLSIVSQILLVSNLGNVWGTVKRIFAQAQPWLLFLKRGTLIEFRLCAHTDVKRHSA